MNWFPDTLRIITTILAICYIPVLYLRVRHTETTVNVVHLFGTFFFVMAIIVASYQAKGSGFHYAQPLNLAAVVTTLYSGYMAIRDSRRKK